MAETITRQYREPFVETAGLATTEEGLRLLKQAIPTQTYTGQQFVAGLSPVEQEAITARGGLGAYEPQLQTAGATLAKVAPYQQQLQTAGATLAGVAPYQQQLQAAGQTLGGVSQYMGPTAYQQFESPYQQDVIQTTQDLLERQRQQGLGALQAQAVGAGAFGGAREGVARGAYEAERDIGAAQLLAQLRQQGFEQAQQQAAQAFSQQQALAQEQARQAQLGQQLAQQEITGLGQLGGMQRQISQAQLAAEQEKAREAAFSDFTRLGLVGPQLASVIGGFPAATQVQSTPPPSATQQLLGAGIGALGIGGALKGIFG